MTQDSVATTPESTFGEEGTEDLTEEEEQTEEESMEEEATRVLSPPTTPSLSAASPSQSFSSSASPVPNSPEFSPFSLHQAYPPLVFTSSPTSATPVKMHPQQQQQQQQQQQYTPMMALSTTHQYYASQYYNNDDARVPEMDPTLTSLQPNVSDEFLSNQLHLTTETSNTEEDWITVDFVLDFLSDEV